MDIRKVKKLIELLEESGIAELEIKEGEDSVRISRQNTVMQNAAPVAMAPAAAAPAANAVDLDVQITEEYVLDSDGIISVRILREPDCYSERHEVCG